MHDRECNSIELVGYVADLSTAKKIETRYSNCLFKTKNIAYRKCEFKARSREAAGGEYELTSDQIQSRQLVDDRCE